VDVACRWISPRAVPGSDVAGVAVPPDPQPLAAPGAGEEASGARCG